MNDEIDWLKAEKVESYCKGLNGLLKSDVLNYYTELGSVMVRLSEI